MGPTPEQLCDFLNQGLRLAHSEERSTMFANDAELYVSSLLAQTFPQSCQLLELTLETPGVPKSYFIVLRSEDFLIDSHPKPWREYLEKVATTFTDRGYPRGQVSEKPMTTVDVDLDFVAWMPILDRWMEEAKAQWEAGHLQATSAGVEQLRARPRI